MLSRKGKPSIQHSELSPNPVVGLFCMRTLEELESELQYRFKDTELLQRALVHSSHAHERNLSDNEQLEFLGDAVLGFLISDFLYRAHPNLTEGQLSKIKGFLVSSANLVKFAERIHLGDYLQLGRGEEKTGGRAKQALLVDAFEALIAAVYLDGGMEHARNIMFRFFQPQVDEIGETSLAIADFKSALQEALQARHKTAAEYVVVSETGPDHQKLFSVEVRVDSEPIAVGIGLTKKAAEQAAARRALEKLNEEEPKTEG